ncbi:hypothetical protein B0T26DRAFT_453303 [Lasiosphaeria miniovina]|uniref:UBC core domain-containing protein n=1 Tax=Lasiosphaeria miniovina TaxID=1954250 RepID=A0AA39ZZA4_9PEZI|nr:uncharacterized protein B0T26DRAFT_453303 [Lasiosphaeria miniovina]KAK0706418.1 hypothetical protein B0T26DRAFT_453303 [Lasiosphaeria miniovina]
MARRNFKTDIPAAAGKAATGVLAGISSIEEGGSEGEFVISYHHPSLEKVVHIQAVATDISEYPDGNMFMVSCTDNDGASQAVIDTLTAIKDYLVGITVYELVFELSKHLESALNRVPGRPGRNDLGTETEDGDNDEPENGDDEDSLGNDADYDDDDNSEDEFEFDGEAFGLSSLDPRQPVTAGESRAQKTRFKRDLRQVKDAGYKVGIFSDFNSQAIFSISIRIGKLGLSDEAIEAWDVDEKDYVVLLVRFESAYAGLEGIVEEAVANTRVSFRIGKCRRYKPSMAQVLAAFSEVKCYTKAASSTESDSQTRVDHVFEKLFVSSSLDQFLNESFVSLLKLRERGSLSWEDANELLSARLGFGTAENVSFEPKEAGSGLAAEDHQVLALDHLTKADPSTQGSFPLAAMQFAMHYFLKCTEYCLRCHRRLEKGFEALRPYVCANPLCLFQYMAMGLGPSIEREILTEPYVVDLLVSLCYAAIQPDAGYKDNSPGDKQTPPAIRTLPTGLRLSVPNLASETEDTPIKVQVSPSTNRITLKEVMSDRHLMLNRWVAFRALGQTVTTHAVIVAIPEPGSWFDIEIMGESGRNWGTGLMGNVSLNMAPTGPKDYRAELFFYDTDFDSLLMQEKCEIMRHILDTLPSIRDIGCFLHNHAHGSLRSMSRISPPAASLLQWIVSSNRSCILQVDRSLKEVGEAGLDKAQRLSGKGRNREHERIPGLDGWIQFRFAQGSPDKELRFNRALHDVAARNDISANPTIFAWHGSNLSNWHSIIRTGLDFKDIRNGRASGNGVYFSRHYSTSIAYVQNSSRPWPNSALKVGACMSLNEIINLPGEFVSTNPHYVVSQLDWHQCRYLFVQSANHSTVFTSGIGLGSAGFIIWPKQQVPTGDGIHGQDPSRVIYGPNNASIEIPLSAIPFRDVNAGSADGPVSRVSKTSMKRGVLLLEDDSSVEDDIDIEFLHSDDEESEGKSPPHKKSHSHSSSIDAAGVYPLSHGSHPYHGLHKDSSIRRPPTPPSMDPTLTSFKPGALDLSTLVRLKPPSFASDFATRQLSHELKKMQAVQANTPLQELGWYMDFDEITNLFQWIIELHSFDCSLPLAKDMKEANVSSIVLEVRFGGDFPMSPPFVRIIRPRFLPFMNGGGGHVTGGGAMCMELLTLSGWTPVNSMESVILQVRMAITNTEPFPARLEKKTHQLNDYGIGEAVEAYRRAATAHGWEIPKELQQTADGV